MVQRHGKRAVLCRCLDGRRGLGIDKVSYRATRGVSFGRLGVAVVYEHHLLIWEV